MPSPDLGRRALPLLRLLEVALLVGAALFALVFHLRLPSRLPTEEDYRAAAAHLTAHARPGDAVVLHPWWTDRARLFVPPSLPLWSDVHNLTRDYAEAPRLWVLSQPELPRTDEEGFSRAFLPGRTPEGEPVRFGTLVLTPYRNGRHRPAAFRATDALAQARVYVEDLRSGARTACPWDGKAHRCPRGGHEGVSVGWRELGFAPFRCLWLPPPGGAARLVAEFDAVPASSLLRLEGGVVGEDAVYTFPRLTPAHLGVEDAASGESLLSLTVPPGREGLQRVERALAAGGAPRGVRVWTQADSAERRSVCLDLAALGPPVAEEPVR